MGRVYRPPTNRYVIEGDTIRVEAGSEVHKVSGTSMAGILGRSPWSSPFQVACNLLGLCSEDIGDKPAVKVGVALEGEIIDYADRTYTSVGAFFPAEKIYEKRAGDHDAWVSDFEDDTFAGHVDGIVMAEDGDYILEVKTSGNMDAWVDGVPEYYKLQVMLYNHFVTHQDKAYVILGKVNENTYADYHSWIPNERTVALFELPIDDGEFQNTLDSVKEWYKEYILKGVTPPYDPSNQGDVEIYNHLVGLAKDVEEVRTMVDAYRDLTWEIDALEAEHKDKYDARETLKTRIKEYMEAHELSSLDDTGSGTKAVLSEQVRKSLDERSMEKDGIDLEKYRIRKTIKIFKLKE